MPDCLLPLPGINKLAFLFFCVRILTPPDNLTASCFLWFDNSWNVCTSPHIGPVLDGDGRCNTSQQTPKPTGPWRVDGPSTCPLASRSPVPADSRVSHLEQNEKRSPLRSPLLGEFLGHLEALELKTSLAYSLSSLELFAGRWKTQLDIGRRRPQRF